MPYRIGEVARRTGLASSAIRYYERERLIPRATREGNARVFDDDILDRLALIELAKQAGFTIAETRDLVRGVERSTPPGPRWRKLAERKLVEVEARIREAERMRNVLKQVMRCDCPTFEDCTRAGC